MPDNQTAIRFISCCAAMALLTTALSMADAASAATCGETVVGSVTTHERGNIPVHTVAEAGLFVSHMHVNADGAPDAYTPDGTGLSYTCDGVVAFERGRCIFPGQDSWERRCIEAYRSWKANGYRGDHVCAFGFQVVGGRRVRSTTVGGRPSIQGPTDPSPGNFVSETSLNIPGHARNSQRRYINSREIPFIVLSRKVRRMIGASLGDIAVIHRPKTGKTVYAVFADTGPAWGLGEGSIALHNAVGNNPIYRRNGVNRAKRGIIDDVVYLVFPESRVQPTADHIEFRRRIETTARDRFKSWGGSGLLSACLRAVRP